jgi:subtilisin family serine protease
VAISNNSWGGGGASSALANAIGRARTFGHIFVAAAGNSGANNDTANFYPANYITTYDNMVTVAAVDRNGNLASFSNYGATRVTLGAPGVSILSTTPNNTYSTYSGTSMATPQVSGALAVLKDQNPSWNYTQLINKLKSSTVPLDTAGPKVTTSQFSGPSAGSFNSIRVTFDEAVNASSFTTADVVALSGPGGTIVPSAVTLVSGSSNRSFDISFPTQSAAGTYTLTIGPDIFDIAGNRMNQNGNSVNGETPGDRFTTTSSIGDTYTFGAGNLPVNIPDLKTVRIPIVVNQDVRITDLDVRLSITHTYDSDLVISLLGPNGVTRILSNRRGGSGDNFSGTVFRFVPAGAVIDLVRRHQRPRDLAVDRLG